MAAIVLLAQRAAAQAPVAIVEDVKSGSAGVEFMDYVEPGKRVPLQGGDTLTLGYLKSCWRESIVGGTVTVGPEQSDVRGGTVTRTKERCDGGQMQLTPEQAKQSGAMAFRRVPKPGAAKVPEEPSLTLYGRMPVFELRQAGRLSIERLDQPGEPIAIDVQAHQLVRGAFFDLARSGTSLAAGGLYRASQNGRQVVFRIAESAAPGATPLVGRMVRFQGAP
jgi:hypothetical protein